MEQVEEVIIGTSKQTSNPSNIGRHALLLANYPESVPGYSVQQEGASGLMAVAEGFMSIKAGNAKLVMAGGAESMSQIPLEIEGSRFVPFNENSKIIFDPISEMEIGAQPESKYGKLTRQDIAKATAKQYGVSDDAAAAYAKKSAEKANATDFSAGMIPVEVRVKKDMVAIDTDNIGEGDLIAKGADAAGIVILSEEETASKEGMATLAEVLSAGFGASTPTDVVSAMDVAIQNALKKADLSLSDVDVIEMDEPSAAQGVAMEQKLIAGGADAAKINVAGGALATGGAWGGMGGALLVKLVHILKAGQKGLVVMSADGGQATALLIEKK